ncbi:hypothetical protein [Clostridium scatologenes]|uniref:Uncharacterized protein n=1 Tax=Clostridium scatologenes TaxID=1548 RepID=A0A0E3K3W3_CLOSL|nr:hypothetical protein [Clostridium scatologenes]AKA71970.1 hypothetical protein CSCA_4845 [Clostridium scatologenes]
MIEQLNNAVKFMAFFTASKVGKTGITVTIDVFNPSGTKIVTDGSTVELGDGIYTYTLANTNTSSEGEYVAIFKTADTTVDMQQIPSLWIIGRAGIEHLDSNISDKATQTSVSAIPTTPLLSTDSRLNNLDSKVSLIPTSPVLSTDTRLDNLDSKVSLIPKNPLLTNDSRLDNLDAKISTISGGGSPLQSNDTRLDKLANLDVLVSTRASQTSISSIPTNPLLTNDTRLDNLDAKISSISGGGSPLQSTDSRLDKLANLDVLVSSRATGTNQLLSTDTRLDNLDAKISTRSSQESVAAIPTNPLLTNDTRLNNLDSKVSSALQTGDSRLDKLNNLDTTVSSRATQTSVDSITGSGKTKWTYILTLADGVTPIPSANIWITTDIEGNNIISSTVTDSYGQANFAVDKGTVYVWCAKTGYKFNNPDTEVIA